MYNYGDYEILISRPTDVGCKVKILKPKDATYTVKERICPWPTAAQALAWAINIIETTEV